MKGRRLRVARALTAFASIIAMAGCQSAKKRADAGPPARTDAPPPYAAIAGAYNARVAPLTRLWARSVVRVWYPDEEGEEQTNQVEGHLMFEPPDRLYLTFNKLGETYAVLGSDADQYWWIQLGEERRAWTGRHDRLTGEPAKGGREIGLPVQPLDLLELLGVLPLPEVPEPAARVGWSADGKRVEVTVSVHRREGGEGRRVRLALDEKSLLPGRIELLDEHDGVLMGADLESYEPVKIPRAAEGAGPPIATRFIASLDSGTKRFRLWLYDPERRAAPAGPKVYDWAWLQKTYRVEDVESLDEPG